MKSYSTPSVVISNSIHYGSLLKEKQFHLRLYVIPFIFAYSLWILGFFYLLSLSSIPSWLVHKEFYLIPLALILFIHFITFMSRFWSIRAYSSLDFVSAHITDASYVFLKPKEHRGKAEVTPIIRNEKHGIYFEFQQQKYIYDKERKVFSKPHNRMQFSIREALGNTGLSSIDASSMMETIGPNQFTIPTPTFLDLFKEHAVAPFFVFQVFCVGLWCLDDYWYYSVFTLFMFAIFESTVVYQRLRNIKDFQTMSIPSIPLKIMRDGVFIDSRSIKLVPGDICILSLDSNSELTVPCDMLLIHGNCIVNEAMLSGESIPLLKEAVDTLADDDELDLLDVENKGHIIYGGTKILQISKSLEHQEENQIVCLVVNTGFSTIQGRLIRMMMFSNERVSANNFESFLFILCLMVFAIMAAIYVLIKGSQDESRSKYKLLVECALIITAVVPPELPMELSLAVNTSLLALSKFAIFCMEPFRIPFAGKVDVCCFDKTGTLTSETLVVDGVAMSGNEIISDYQKIPASTGVVLASCHSLFTVNGKVTGDPMEKATMDYLKASLNQNEIISWNDQAIQTYHRFQFSSSLKRMSVIAGVKNSKDHSSHVIAAVKGAPEIIAKMIKNLPQDYEKTYKHLARTGARVLALGFKTLKATNMSHEKARKYHREEIESDLEFSGFLCLRCPLKPDSKGAITALTNSLHHVVMITGDNYLTAIHTAKDLRMVHGQDIFVVDSDGSKDLSIYNYETEKEVTEESMVEQDGFICLNGDAISVMLKERLDLFDKVQKRVAIFARSSPIQKEDILAYYKSKDMITLMCGDGTNDVGALKQAHVGIALLDGKPEDMQKILYEMRIQAIKRQKAEFEATARSFRQKFSPETPEAKAVSEKLDSSLNSMLGEDSMDGPTFRLGDASVAAPFSSRISTVESVCHIIRQGRCTLVTTIQMYKILAINSLISAYGFSVLNLAGVRYGDFQATITGVLLSLCFMFLTKAEPIKKLSPMRPQSNIFNPYLITSVLGQFVLHVASLVFIVSAASKYEFKRAIDPKNEFEQGLVNTAVYIISLLMQVSTFVINYQGRPFREGLLENKPLRTSLMIVGGISVITALEWAPEFNEWLQLVAMPPIFKRKLIMTMLMNWFGCYYVEFTAWKFFFSK